jgi:hypothetical protein
LRPSLHLTAELFGISKTRYPFNFVVKHRLPIAVSIGASPEALETFSVSGFNFKTKIQTPTVSRSAPCFEEGGELETANEELFRLRKCFGATCCLR